MKCPKCGSIDTKKVSVLDENWRSGTERCKSCNYQDNWTMFCENSLKPQNYDFQIAEEVCTPLGRGKVVAVYKEDSLLELYIQNYGLVYYKLDQIKQRQDMTQQENQNEYEVLHSNYYIIKSKLKQKKQNNGEHSIYKTILNYNILDKTSNYRQIQIVEPSIRLYANYNDGSSNVYFIGEITLKDYNHDLFKCKKTLKNTHTKDIGIAHYTTSGSSDGCLSFKVYVNKDQYVKNSDAIDDKIEQEFTNWVAQISCYVADANYDIKKANEDSAKYIKENQKNQETLMKKIEKFNSKNAAKA